MLKKNKIILSACVLAISGAANAGLLAAQIIGTFDPTVQAAVEKFRTEQTQTILDNPNPAE